MKKIVLSLFLLSLLAISWTTVKHGFGSIGGFTGSITDGDNCMTCHPQNSGKAGYWVYPVGMSANGFISGDIVTIYLFAEQDGMKNAGFEMTAEDSQGNKIGNFMITDSVQTRLTNKGSVTHTGNGHETSSEFKSWTVDLYIPHSAPDTFKLYTAFNMNNGHYGQHDTTRLHSYKFYKSPIGSATLVEGKDDFFCYPNPCATELNIKTEQKIQKVQLFDLNGKLVFASGETHRVNTSNLNKGTYILHLLGENKTYTEKIIKL